MCWGCYGEHKINIFAFFLWVWQLRHILAHTPLEFIQWIKCEHRQSILISYQHRGFFRRLLWEGDRDLRCWCFFDAVNKISICGVAVISNLTVCDVCVFHTAVFREMKLFTVLWFLVWLGDAVFNNFLGGVAVFRPLPPLLWKANVGLSWQYSWEIIVSRNRSHSRSIKVINQTPEAKLQIQHKNASWKGQGAWVINQTGVTSKWMPSFQVFLVKPEWLTQD